MERESGLTRPGSIGIGTPGIHDPKTGRMKNSNTVCLIGHDLRSDLDARLGTKLLMANDANCFALAEATLGAARGYPVVFGVILGTGVGGGVVAHGRVLEGLHGIAGEWSHNLLEKDGPECYCGKKGCVETFISGPALERHYEQLSGSKLALAEIAKKDSEGSDSNATATIGRLCECFAKAIAGVINILDPDAIVLGGGVGNIERLHSDGVAGAAKNVFNGSLDTRFLRPRLGDSAGVIGTALLTKDGG